jgi:hypothetical protein
MTQLGWLNCQVSGDKDKPFAVGMLEGSFESPANAQVDGMMKSTQTILLSSEPINQRRGLVTAAIILSTAPPRASISARTAWMQ